MLQTTVGISSSSETCRYRMQQHVRPSTPLIEACIYMSLISLSCRGQRTVLNFLREAIILQAKKKSLPSVSPSNNRVKSAFLPFTETVRKAGWVTSLIYIQYSFSRHDCVNLYQDQCTIQYRLGGNAWKIRMHTSSQLSSWEINSNFDTEGTAWLRVPGWGI